MDYNRRCITITKEDMEALRIGALDDMSMMKEILGEAVIYLFCGFGPSTPLSKMFAHMLDADLTREEKNCQIR